MKTQCALENDMGSVACDSPAPVTMTSGRSQPQDAVKKMPVFCLSLFL